MKKSSDKIRFIIDYLENLLFTFKNIKEFQQNHDEYIIKLRNINRNNNDIPAYLYPFVIKGYKFFNNDKNKLHELFHLLEILAVRNEVVRTRADIRDRLKNCLLTFDGDMEKLRNSFRDKIDKEDYWYYWSDVCFKSSVVNMLFGHKMIPYILWEYENTLQNKGYKTNVNVTIDYDSIEHISPQTPREYSLGYETNEDYNYSDDFKDHYLNNIGNLMLISRSHNCSIGNKPFSEKLKSYKDNPILSQQAEISSFLTDGKEEWKSEQITKRRDKIVKMAMERWSFDY